MAIPSYDKIFTSEIEDMKSEIEMIAQQDPDMYQYFHEILDNLYRYGISKYNFKMLMSHNFND